MSVEECLACKNLLLAAGRAILAHLEAVSRFEKAVIEAPVRNIAGLEANVLDAGIARENAVLAYESHRVSHQAKVRTAGS
jgi:hypothetical protein